MAALGCVLVATTGCDDLFNLEMVSLPPDGKPASTLVPVQTVTSQRDQAALDMPVAHVIPMISPTTPGHALVIAAVVETSSFDITSITDDGGNEWLPVLEGQDPDEVADVRLEVWRSISHQSTSTVTVTIGNDRELGVIFTEWDLPGTVDGSLGGVYAETAMPVSGALTTGAPALLLAAMAYKSGVPPMASDPSFVSLNQAGLGGVNVGAWYRPLEAGTFDTSWTLPASAATVTGLVAFTVE